MSAFKHIVVPTDFSAPAEKALALGLEIAEKFGANVTLLYANWMPPMAYAAFAEGIVWPTEELDKGAREALDAAVAASRKQYARVEGALVVDEPWRAILDYATKRNADLIVMGTHGRGGFVRFVLGSVADKIVRSSTIPVLTVPAT